MKNWSNGVSHLDPFGSAATFTVKGRAISSGPLEGPSCYSASSLIMRLSRTMIQSLSTNTPTALWIMFNKCFIESQKINKYVPITCGKTNKIFFNLHFIFAIRLLLLLSNDPLFDFNKNKNNNKNNNKASSDNATQYTMINGINSILGEKQNYGCFLTWKY